MGKSRSGLKIRVSSLKPEEDAALKRRSLPHLLLVLVAGAMLGTAYPSLAENALLTTQDRQDILGTIAAIRNAILNADTAQLLRYISESEGLTCTDALYSYKAITRFMKDKDSHLYMSLFDSVGFAQRCGRDYPKEYPAISDREFLKTAEDSASIEADGHDWVEVTIRSRIPNHWPRTWSLHREGAGWKLAGRAVIIGDCVCG
jgi:hypothetical protein